jgi:Fic family protein
LDAFNAFTMIEPPPAVVYNEEDLQFFLDHMEEVRVINATYPYYNKAKYKFKEAGLDPIAGWKALKMLRQGFSNALPFSIYTTYNKSIEMESLLHYLDKETCGSLESDGPHPYSSRSKLIVSALFEEAYASSTLEGAITTRDVAKELIRTNRKPRDKSESMILNNYRAMEMIRNNRNQDLTLELLFELHEIVGVGTMDQGEADTYRNEKQKIVVMDAVTGEQIHIPPSADSVPRLMNELITFFNQKQDFPSSSGKPFHHPILRASIVHFMIGYIHPFADGNGRVGRSLFYWHMLRNNYWIIEYLAISQVILKSKNSYYKAFQETELDSNDLTYFLKYHTEALVKALKRMKEYLEKKKRENGSDLNAYIDKFNITMREAKLFVQIQKSNRNWMVKDVQQELDISPNTAKKALVALEEKGLIASFPIDKKTTGWKLT